MSTKVRELLAAKAAIKAAAEAMPEGQTIVAQFQTEDGESTGPPLNLPADVNPEQLELLLNQLLQQVGFSLFDLFMRCTHFLLLFRRKILYRIHFMWAMMKSAKTCGPIAKTSPLKIPLPLFINLKLYSVCELLHAALPHLQVRHKRPIVLFDSSTPFFFFLRPYGSDFISLLQSQWWSISNRFWRHDGTDMGSTHGNPATHTQGPHGMGAQHCLVSWRHDTGLWQHGQHSTSMGCKDREANRHRLTRTHQMDHQLGLATVPSELQSQPPGELFQRRHGAGVGHRTTQNGLQHCSTYRRGLLCEMGWRESDLYRLTR